MIDSFINIYKKIHTEDKTTGLARVVAGLLGILFLLSSMAIPISAAQPADESGKVYLILVDKLSIYDISPQSTPHLTRLIDNGAVGLASNRTLRGRNNMDTSITMGAGNIGRVYANGIMAYNHDEYVTERRQDARDLYRKSTGFDPGMSSCLLVNLPEIYIGMEKEKVTTLPGAMGEVLRLNNHPVCVLGNGDNSEQHLRAGVVVAMDSRGQVPLGDVGPDTILNNPTSFLSRETNYNHLLQQIDIYNVQADLFVVDLSDLARLDVEANTAFPTIAEQEKQKRLSLIDNFVHQIEKNMNPTRDNLLVVSLSPAREQVGNKNLFTPVIAYGEGIERGFLTSSATRRDYVVANTDIAPTVLQYFGLNDQTGTMIGRPFITTPADGDTLQAAQGLCSLTSTVNRLRVPLIKGYVVLQIIIILLALASIFWLKEISRFVEIAIVALVAFPLVLLPLGKLPAGPDWMYILVAIAATIFISWALMRLFHGNAFTSFFALSLGTVVLLSFDLLTGTSMIQSSVLGYDPMAGARYYGIGNEYMGILLGSTIATAAIFYERFKGRSGLLLVALLFAFESYLIASPHLGANSGGMLAGPFAFLVTFLLLGEVRMRPRTVLAALGVAVLILASVAFYDMTRPIELQTHIGRAANQIASGGWTQGLIIIMRKLAMNLKLIRYTIWSWVFIVILLVLALLVYRPVGAMAQLRQERPYIVKGFGGIITGALVALAVNDSGIVAASTTSIYLVVPLLILMLQWHKRIFNLTEKLPDSPDQGEAADENGA